MHAGTLLPPSPRLDPCALGGVWGAFLFLIMYRLGVTSPVLAPAGTPDQTFLPLWGNDTVRPGKAQAHQKLATSSLRRASPPTAPPPCPQVVRGKASGQTEEEKGPRQSGEHWNKETREIPAGQEGGQGLALPLCFNLLVVCYPQLQSSPKKRGHPRPPLQHRSASGDGLWDLSY